MIHLEPNDDSDEFSPFDITPLVDIVFLLLIFFLLTASFTYPTMHLKLPQSRSAKAGLHRPDYTISILRDGEILVNNRPVSIGTLGKIPPNSSVLILEDTNGPYGRFVEVLDRLMIKGVAEISIATKKK
ncbi:MAG: hypothetical protein DRG37_03660 [Deltaproteobacteria bacterium]|nr:MAG: hypothetical protein DRG37_03660 [Deltaproteobacteria bacterium]